MSKFIEYATSRAISIFDGAHFVSVTNAFTAIDEFRRELKGKVFTAQTLLQIEDFPGDNDEVIVTITERGKNSANAIIRFATTITDRGFTLSLMTGD